MTKCHGSLGQVSLQVWELHSASILVDGPTGICGKGRLETLRGRGGGLVLVLWRSNGPVTLIENVGHQWLERSDWELGALGRWVPQVDLHAWETSAFKVAGVIMFRRRPGTGRFAGRASVNARAQVLGIGFVGSLGHPWWVLARRIKQKKIAVDEASQNWWL